MVERPAAVVKELVENALDAGATRVEVALETGGKRRITVRDDGCGMDRDDALLAFDRHATSKIAAVEDLEQVGSLGFRGEALASIAAVARVELVTARQAGDGTRVRIEGGRVRVAEPAAHPRGTSIEVASLFFNVPARRKFLKRPSTELRRAAEVVQGYALARPEVGFSLTHEGRTLLDLPPAAAGARQRIGELFGTALTDRLEEIEGAAAGGRISGFVGDPGTARGRRTFTFVNRRLLRDRAVLAVFYRAVRDVWRSEEFPALFLFLEVPAGQVDVNVHPQKAEVRFRDPGLLDKVSRALRAALERALGEVAAPAQPAAGRPAMPFAWQGRGAAPQDGGIAEAPGEVAEAAAGVVRQAPPAAPPGPRLAEISYAPLERPAVPLSGRRGEPRPFRLLGQYKGTLILLEGPDGLYLVDQHVAHERLLYERLRRSLAGGPVPVQQLLEPLLLELAPAEALRLDELAPALDGCGFPLRKLSGDTLALTGVPSVLGAAEAERLLLELAGSDEVAPADLRRRLLESLAASLSCRAAVKMHEPLSAVEMEALVGELFAAEQPYACPHGRPIVLKMSDADLERRFGRR